MGIKPLGNSGTFRGSAAYNYEMQKDRNRVLTLTPYSGDAFFFTDTTSGDFRYSGPTFEFMYSLETFDNLFEQQFRVIAHPMQLNEFFKILTPITARVGCGHTNVWMPGKYWNSNPNKLFPLQIKMIEGNVVVTDNYNNESQVPKGSIILKINDVPIEVIYDEMKRNYSADAFNQHFIISQIERRFSLLIYASGASIVPSNPAMILILGASACTTPIDP